MPTFADLIRLRPEGDNLWAGEADRDYSHPGGQFGGWTAAALLKAVLSEPGERGPPLTMTVMFTDAIGDGAIEIATRSLRAGSRLQFWRAEVRQREKLCAHAQITFGVRRAATGFADAVRLFDLPPPDDPRMETFGPPAPIGEKLEARSLPSPGHYKPGEGLATTAFWARHKPAIGLDYCTLALLADHAPPRPMIKLGGFVLSSTISMNIYFHASPDELAAAGDGFVQSDAVSRRCEGGYFDHELKLWSQSGVLLATSEQMATYRD